MKTGWLSEELKMEILKIFEPRYKRELSEEEVIEIAENLTTGLEGILKFTWKEKYRDGI